MPVPFEALIPLGLITGFFGVSGLLFQKLKTSMNDGQPKASKPSLIDKQRAFLKQDRLQEEQEILREQWRGHDKHYAQFEGISGTPPRYGVDRWDRVMMDRDYRLTGSQRGQSHQTSAPAGFSTSSAWTLEKEHL